MTIIWDSIAETVLDKNQKTIKPLLEEFSKTHILVWWTAIALQIWHRKSIDFDLFTFDKQWTWKELFNKINKTWLSFDIENSSKFWLNEDEQSEIILFINWVKIQIIDFSRNPFNINLCLKSNKILSNWINSLDLLNLWVLKLYAMMYRSKLKDAVDLYFILKTGIKFNDIVKKTEEIFTKLYDKKYSFETIINNNWDNTEEIDYIIENPPKFEIIQNHLENELKIYINNF